MKIKSSVAYGGTSTKMSEDIFDDIRESEKVLTEIGKNQAIAISKLKPSVQNEDYFDMEGIDEFAESINETGYEGSQPIGVYDLGDGTYEIYSGHRRYESAKKAGLDVLPCYIKPLPTTESEKLMDLLRCNQHLRGKQSPLKIAKQVDAYKRVVLDGETYKRKKCAVFFGISESNVQRYEDLLQLVPQIQKYAESDVISWSALSKAGNLEEDKQLQLKELIDTHLKSNETLSKSRLLQMIEDIKDGKTEEKEKSKAKEKKSVDDDITKAISKLEKLAQKKNLHIENPELMLSEIRKLNKIYESLKLKIEDVK